MCTPDAPLLPQAEESSPVLLTCLHCTGIKPIPHQAFVLAKFHVPSLLDSYV